MLGLLVGLLLVGLRVEPRCPDPTRMVYVAASRFVMGSDAAERQFAYTLSSPAVRQAAWFGAELSRRSVELGPFCIDRYLVTQDEYAAFLSPTGHRAPGITRDEYLRQGFLVHDYDREVTPYLWHGGKPPDRFRDHPVVLVSAFDAEAFCRWRHADLRLPSEAEWEKAARGDRGSIFPWGDTWDPGRLNSAASGTGSTTPVTQFPGGVSPYGLHDAVGNVFQWTSSRLADGRRVLKSCAWDDEPGLCRPAFHHGRPAASRHILFGFRCAGPPQR